MKSRFLLLCVIAVLGAACSDSKKGPKPPDGADAGQHEDGSTNADDASAPNDAGAPSALPRPSLERPPTQGLPADLRPPR